MLCMRVNSNDFMRYRGNWFSPSLCSIRGPDKSYMNIYKAYVEEYSMIGRTNRRINTVNFEAENMLLNILVCCEMLLNDKTMHLVIACL